MELTSQITLPDAADAIGAVHHLSDRRIEFGRTTVDVDSNWRAVIDVGVDEWSSVCDIPDCMGSVSDVMSYRRDGQPQPGDNEETVPVDRGAYLIWTHPFDWATLDAGVQNAIRDELTDIAQFGWYVMHVSLHQRLRDVLGGEHYVPVAQAHLGQISPADTMDLSFDLLHELLSDIAPDNTDTRTQEASR